MSWVNHASLARHPALTMDECGPRLVLNRALQAEMLRVDWVEILVDGERLALSPAPSGAKVVRTLTYGKYPRASIRSAREIRALGLEQGDRLLFTGMEDGMFVFEKEAGGGLS